MSAQTIAATLGIDEQQLQDMFAVYLSLHELHTRMDFEEALADPAVRICLKNTAHARREALQRRRSKSANDSSKFELTP